MSRKRSLSGRPLPVLGRRDCPPDPAFARLNIRLLVIREDEPGLANESRMRERLLSTSSMRAQLPRMLQQSSTEITGAGGGDRGSAASKRRGILASS